MFDSTHDPSGLGHSTAVSGELPRLKHAAPEDIPADESLFSAHGLEAHLAAQAEPPLSVIVAGDIMLGGRARRVLADQGPDYAFAAVRPLLARASIVTANLEGPFARKAPKMPRTYSYRVHPRLAPALARAGIGVVTLANNHLLDCGREGVLETLDVLAKAGIKAIGGGIDRAAAHAPVTLNAGAHRVGLLGYYWNRRCAATSKKPGSAVGTPKALAADIQELRNEVDRIVVMFHWGVPYIAEPSAEDQETARFAIDCGADVVVGHHPHVIQPFEVYQRRPIVYSVGNFAFGSGNSRAEGMLVGIRFLEHETVVQFHPMYVKNRDPRVAYQPKMLRADGAARALRRLAEISGPHGRMLRLEGERGTLELRRDQS